VTINFRFISTSFFVDELRFEKMNPPKSVQTKHIDINFSIFIWSQNVVATAPAANENASKGHRAHVQRSGDVFPRMRSRGRHGWWHWKDSVNDAGVDA
jgi:hypothetical protein